METEFIVIEEEDLWRCGKHPTTRPRSGICPSCLRDRLLLLCPDCANMRPCSCFPSASSSSSSFSSHSSFDPARSSISGAIGGIGRVSCLIESEPAFRRSRSVALPFPRPRSDPEAERLEKGRSMRWGGFWWFLKAKEKKEPGVLENEGRSEIERLSRSRSVGVSDSGSSKGKRWHFPSPIRAFRHKKTAKVVQERSPLCRR